jgi:hypothetical protein
LADARAKEFRRWLFSSDLEGAKAQARWYTSQIGPAFNQPMAHPMNWEKAAIYYFIYLPPAVIGGAVPPNHNNGANPWGHHWLSGHH